MEVLSTIKNILNRISFHPLFFLLVISIIITGYFKPFIIYFSLIFIHELGHFLVGMYFNFDIDKIYFYPFGGYSKFNSEINKPLKEELMVLLGGPISQVLFYLTMSYIFNLGDTFRIYHYGLLFFNLLPIYPLDGGKLINILLCYKFPYLKSYNFVIIISVISLVLLFILSIKYYYNFNIILVSIFLLYKIYEYYKEKKYSYNKFLLERYLRKYDFKKYKFIKSIKNVYRDKKHIINNETEKSALKKYFNKY